MLKRMLITDVSQPCQQLTEAECYQVWLGLTSLSRDSDHSCAILEQYVELDYKSLQRKIFEINISELCESREPEKPVVGVWWQPGCFGSQLTPIAKRLNEVPRYRYLGIVSADYLSHNTIRHLEDFQWGEYLAIPEPQDMGQLEFLAVIIFSENYLWKTYLPKKVIRVAQPHGLDVPLGQTMKRYGGPIIFDYVFSPLREKLDADKMDLTFFPLPILEHDSDSFCSIPVGYPKLDYFTDQCERTQIQKKIIYHISLMGIEDAIVRRNIGKTIQLLLDNFSDRQILFRPDPRDIDNPDLLSQLDPFRELPNFSISRASSYVEDYADAELLVTHRTVTAHTFAYASGRPVIAFCPSSLKRPYRRKKKLDVGYHVFTEKQLVNIVSQILTNPLNETSRIQECRDRMFYNSGGALDYIIDHFDYILEKRKHPDWSYYSLPSRAGEKNDCAQIKSTIRRALQVAKGGEYVCVAEAATDLCYEDAELHLNTAILHARFPEPFQHHIYFQFWYRSVYHLAKAVELNSSEPEFQKKLQKWVATRGLFMAMSVKWYVDMASPAFGSDIDLIISTLNKTQMSGNYYKKLSKEPIVEVLKKKFARKFA